MADADVGADHDHFGILYLLLQEDILYFWNFLEMRAPVMHSCVYTIRPACLRAVARADSLVVDCD